MRAAFALVDARVAEAPFALVARVALPVAVVGVLVADGAKGAGLKTCRWVFGRHQLAI